MNRANPIVGEFVQDGRAEAKITDIDGAMVEIEYTDTRERTHVQDNRIVEQNGSLRVV
jgi:hypothetical protein